MQHPFIRGIIAAAVLSSFNTAVQADTSLDARLKAMETRLNALETENQALKSQLKTTEQKVEATSVQVEKVASNPPATKAAWAEKTRLGGYGELHYNKLDGEGGAADKAETDFHRFVLFLGHEFNSRTRFFSELEVEHALAGEGKKGEVELEQAYVEFDLNDNHRAKAGVFLIPVGILNETHEPTTFYGVERNPIEGAIVPYTWWGGGAAFSGQLGGGFGAAHASKHVPALRWKRAHHVVRHGALPSKGRRPPLGWPGLLGEFAHPLTSPARDWASPVTKR